MPAGSGLNARSYPAGRAPSMRGLSPSFVEWLSFCCVLSLMPASIIYVCWDCRTGVKRSSYVEGSVHCPRCTVPCECLGLNVLVPPKSKEKEWQLLHDRFYCERRRVRLQQAKSRAAKPQSAKSTPVAKSVFERRLSRLRAKQQSVARDTAIRKLLDSQIAQMRDLPQTAVRDMSIRQLRRELAAVEKSLYLAIQTGESNAV
jgi:hypothetical protein